MIKETKYGKFYITNESLSLHMSNKPYDYMWEEYLKPWFDIYATNKVVVEVGASAGWHTIYLARIAKQVYSFEPQTPQYKTLLSNIELNESTNVQTYNKAVYSKFCAMNLTAPVAYGMDGHEACAMSLKVENIGDIEAVTIDDLKFSHVDLIKIDAQGCDLHVMRGAIKTIKRDRPVIIFEWDKDLSTAQQCTYDDYTTFLTENNYKLERLPDRDCLATPL